MLANGVPLLQALKISKDATGSSVLAECIAQASDSVRGGKTLSGPLAVGGVFPDQVLAMIAVAEESNKLDKVLLQIADTVERRTNRQVDQAVRLVEPVIGQIKHARGFRQFLLRGVEKVRGEWSLVCTTHNILKLYRLCS